MASTCTQFVSTPLGLDKCISPLAWLLTCSVSSPVKSVQHFYLHLHFIMPAKILLQANSLPIRNVLDHLTDMCRLFRPAVSSQALHSHANPAVQGCLPDVASQSNDSSSLGRQQQTASVAVYSAAIAPQTHHPQGETRAGLKTCFTAVLTSAIRKQLTMRAAAALLCLLQNHVVPIASPD